MPSAISVESLGKKYVLKHQTRQGSYVALRDVMSEGVKNLGRRLLGGSSRAGEGEREDFWALQDVSFEVQQGDRVGIIGRNGAGKSTLLKILSRITEPSTGSVRIRGRVASLLEVGTGFHPELTGRENIFLNGAILGMSRAEIRRKFDEIVAFAEIERFLDTPVKRYSSGMYVRLAFAVAAHLDPEILIVDEVLAVGDAQFQKKCLGKMEDVSTREGRTVLFVSHNMEAVRKLCDRALLLDAGTLLADGKTDLVLDRYLNHEFLNKSEFLIKMPTDQGLPGYAWKIAIEDVDGRHLDHIKMGQPWQVRVSIRITREIEHVIVGLGMLTSLNLPLRTSWSAPRSFAPGEYEVVFREETLLLTSGKYPLLIGLSSYERAFQYVENAAFLTISEVSDRLDILKVQGSGVLLNAMTAEIRDLSSGC